MRRNPRNFAQVAQRAAEAREQAKEPILVQESYSVYGLNWEKLHGFLANKFPGYPFKRMSMLNDRYIFHIPVPLTMLSVANQMVVGFQEDRDDIQKLCE
ncbi:hypothetical protein VF21_07969 [Pseudogymnoascus sp. 05NY08]|nr:hypothetical protein VF21_07969 [Pseudogymnoascus sp. 05NY08]